MTKSWICNTAALVPGEGIVRPGTVLEYEDGNEPDMVKGCFTCMTPSQVKEKEDAKSIDNDLTYQAKLEKLKDMKVKLPRGCSREKIDALFDEFVAKVELPQIV